MSKPKLVVLGFLSRQKMYGYQIGQVVESFGLPVWAGIRLPSIYRALQDLEASHHIRGEQVTEGNNPPRKVFHINDKGKALHAELVRRYLADPATSSQDWWLVLSFAEGTMEQPMLEELIQSRLKAMAELKHKVQDSDCAQMAASGELPFIYTHIARLGHRHHEADAITLREILKDIRGGTHADFFIRKGV